MRLPKSPLIATAAILVLAGCSPTAVVLWTNVPDLVPAVELYNASQDDHVVELVYHTELASALRLAETRPDLVIGTSISDRATAGMMQPLDRLMRRELEEDAFYADLLASGVRNGRQHLLPVSFNLPLVYFAGGPVDAGTPIIIGPQEIRARGDEFNEARNGSWMRVAYSPIWNPAFLYQYLRTHGFVAREAQNGAPVWPIEALLGGISGAREWMSDHGGLEADRAFQERYLYDPQIELVRRGRVAYGYHTSDRFLLLSDVRRAGLRYRWFGTTDEIRVLERIVYAGIPAGAASRRGAERFLADLFNVERQVEIMESTLRKRASVFGIVGGFSSLWRVTERHMPVLYPQLEGMIPPAGWLRFPPAQPRHWMNLVPQVVEPWLMREVAQAAQTRDLESSVRTWLMQQED